MRQNYSEDSEESHIKKKNFNVKKMKNLEIFALCFQVNNLKQ